MPDLSKTRLVETFYRIEPQQFHYLKFILEGYDNLGVLSAVSAGAGVVRIRCCRESLAELIELMRSLAAVVKRRQLI